MRSTSTKMHVRCNDNDAYNVLHFPNAYTFYILIMIIFGGTVSQHCSALSPNKSICTAVNTNYICIGNESVRHGCMPITSLPCPMKFSIQNGRQFKETIIIIFGRLEKWCHDRWPITHHTYNTHCTALSAYNFIVRLIILRRYIHENNRSSRMMFWFALSSCVPHHCPNSTAIISLLEYTFFVCAICCFFSLHIFGVVVVACGEHHLQFNICLDIQICKSLRFVVASKRKNCVCVCCRWAFLIIRNTIE